MIISAFPTIGKSYAYDHMKNIEGLKVFDSDSSLFSWMYDTKFDMDKFEESGYLQPVTIRRRNPDFPNNYIEYIKENMGSASYMFVSSHENVRHAMKDANIPYILIYPERSMLSEIVGRCYLRGNDDKFIKVLIDNWDSWIDSCENDTGAIDKIVLGHNEYLLDLIARITTNK